MAGLAARGLYRRGLAVLAALAWIGSSLLPPAHRHVGVSDADHEASGIHQHLALHHPSHDDQPEIVDHDDDDHVVQLFDQPSSVGRGGWPQAPRTMVAFEPAAVSADRTWSSVRAGVVTPSPPEPPFPPPSLRAPPSV